MRTIDNLQTTALTNTSSSGVQVEHRQIHRPKHRILVPGDFLIDDPDGLAIMWSCSSPTPPSPFLWAIALTDTSESRISKGSTKSPINLPPTNFHLVFIKTMPFLCVAVWCTPTIRGNHYKSPQCCSQSQPSRCSTQLRRFVISKAVSLMMVFMSGPKSMTGIFPNFQHLIIVNYDPGDFSSVPRTKNIVYFVV